MRVCFFFSTGSTNASTININEKTTPLRRLSISFSLKSLISSPLKNINFNYSILYPYIRTFLVILMICIFSISTLKAKEPFLAMHLKTYSNDMQRFSANNYSFECTPYGISTLERLYNNSKENSPCQKSIEKFYKKNPLLKYYADKLFKYKQIYHIEVKNTECLIYAKGQMNFSELLLGEGLALMQLNFNDEEFKAYFSSLQAKARREKKGLWGENIFNDCISELDRK